MSDWCLEIHHIDVGQGDSTLIIIKDGNTIKKTVLIDCGETSACEYLTSYIKSLVSDMNIDILILSHNHSDHSGYFKQSLMEDYDNYLKDKNKSKGTAKVFYSCFDKSIKYNNKTETRTGFSVPSNNVEILGLGSLGTPKLHCIENSEYTMSSVENDKENRSSLCFILEYGFFRYYTGGDKDGDAETQMKDIIKATDYYKIPHHGGKNASSEDFLFSIKPIVGFISVGDSGKSENFDHPSSDCVGRLMDSVFLENIFMTSCVKDETEFFKKILSQDTKTKQTTKVRVAGESKKNKGGSDIFKKRGNIVLKILSQDNKKQISSVTYYDEYAVGGKGAYISENYIKFKK
jgi:competence protein ComEC